MYGEMISSKITDNWLHRLLEARAPGLTAWAWAVNAVFTLTGSIATVILSMNFGFRFVFLVAVVAYGVAAVAAGPLGEGSVPGKEQRQPSANG